MSYGNDSSDASYEDIFTDSETSETQTAPAFDASKYVPVEKYNELNQTVQSFQPKLEQLDRLNQVFNPTPQQQFTPEELKIAQLAQAIAEQKIAPVQQKQEAFMQQYEMQELDNIAKQNGFEDASDQEDWMLRSNRKLTALGNSGDTKARMTAQTMTQLYNAGQMKQLQQYCLQNLDYIDAYAGPLSRKGNVSNQQIGHSFNNSPFNRQEELSPQQYESKIAELAKAGKFDEIRTLQQKFASQINR